MAPCVCYIGVIVISGDKLDKLRDMRELSTSSVIFSVFFANIIRF